MFNRGLNNFYSYQTMGTKKGFLSLFKGKINWGNILNNTQKTLNIINQAIPVFYQAKPIINNTKTFFKIMGALKEDDSKNTTNKQIKNQNNTSIISSKNNSPNFFL